MLMFDEYEIVAWVKNIDRFNLQQECLSLYDADDILRTTLGHVSYIGIATKMLLNDDENIKDPIFAYLTQVEDS